MAVLREIVSLGVTLTCRYRLSDFPFKQCLRVKEGETIKGWFSPIFFKQTDYLEILKFSF